ncbi:hypothetical protein ANN_14529 [Periplaneta americana]|uniref:Uncharacterized protein n=1 Tax=Periplaneta americana TaxID=6978 RepID=A0ABQ8SWJ9_PERAM|nr:hypothetical protein ANN_14529 [Periplaneta americana]
MVGLCEGGNEPAGFFKAISKLRNRFEGMHNFNHFFKVISPKFLNSDSDEEIHNAAVVLKNEYEEDLSSEFPDQVIGFRNDLKKEIASLTSVADLTNLFVIENAIVAANVPDLCTAFSERSSFVKKYLRNSMTQDKLSELSLISIECDVSEIINIFASQKACRMVQFH